MNVLLAFLNGWEIVAILAVVLLLFGASRLPKLARGLGEGVREFKSATAEEEEKLKKDKTKTEFI
jgi:sec-independent protein translocase protein TatA